METYTAKNTGREETMKEQICKKPVSYWDSLEWKGPWHSDWVNLWFSPNLAGLAIFHIHQIHK